MQFDSIRIRDKTVLLPTGTGISDHDGSCMFLVSETGSVNLEVGSLPATTGGGGDFMGINWVFDHGEGLEGIQEPPKEILGEGLIQYPALCCWQQGWLSR